MSEDNKIIDINDDLLDVRVSMIKKELYNKCASLRESLDENKSSQELVSDVDFKKWVICNEVYNMIDKNVDFYRMTYFLYTQCNNDIENFISLYDIEYELDEDKNIAGIKLITLE